MLAMFNEQKERIKTVVKQQKEQTDRMEVMMKQLLTTKEQNHCLTHMMTQFLTPSPAMLHYQNMPYTQLSVNNQNSLLPIIQVWNDNLSGDSLKYVYVISNFEVEKKSLILDLRRVAVTPSHVCFTVV